jgi:hypothetical protein
MLQAAGLLKTGIAGALDVPAPVAQQGGAETGLA